jgi:hypothetical protein
MVFIGRCSGVAISLAILALLGGAAGGSAQTVPAEQPSPETVAKLIAQLGAADFRSRQQASDRLEKLGGPVLPALRKAAAANTELEAARRIELVVKRIENNLLNTEEKHWKDFDAPRRGIKDRLVKILTKTPAPSDPQVASAVYLLTVGRPPTDEEATRAKKRLADAGPRTAGVLQLARSLVQGKEFSAGVAAANVLLFKAEKDLAAETGFAKMLHRLNTDEFQKLTGDVAAALDKAVKADEHFTDLAFLLVLSRIPAADQSKVALAHLKNAKNRATATTDIVLGPDEHQGIRGGAVVRGGGHAGVYYSCLDFFASCEDLYAASLVS